MERLDASPVRTLDSDAEARMIARIDEAKANADTLGGVVEVIAYGMPAGVGTYVESDRRLDAALAAAAMGVQAIKGVEIGDGFLEAMRPGSQAHDEMVVGDDGHIDRLTNRAGGIEGGMSNGQPIRVRAAMKPIPSIPRRCAPWMWPPVRRPRRSTSVPTAPRCQRRPLWSRPWCASPWPANCSRSSVATVWTRHGATLKAIWPRGQSTCGECHGHHST